MLDSKQSGTRINVVTTKNGDTGYTNLIDKKVHKATPVIQCLGLIDCVNSEIGFTVERYRDFIQNVDFFNKVQNSLFDFAADLLCDTNKTCSITSKEIKEKCDQISIGVSHIENIFKDAINYIELVLPIITKLRPDMCEYLIILSDFLNKTGELAGSASICALLYVSHDIVRDLSALDNVQGAIKYYLDQIKLNLSILISPKTEFQSLECHLKDMETFSDYMNQQLEPLMSFILPKGKFAILHRIRSKIRRCEIMFVMSEEQFSFDTNTFRQYINRCSDFLFIACRYLEMIESRDAEILWERIQTD